MSVVLPTRLDYRQIGRRYIIAHAKKIDPAQVDIQGSNADILLAAPSLMAQAVTRHFAEALRAHTLDADDDDLDREVLDRYPLPRKGAAPAVVPLEFTRTAATAGAGPIPVGTRLSTLTGIDYITTTACSFGASQTTGVSCEARAVQAGFEYQVGRNQIRRFANPGLLFDPTIQVNNSEPAAGGAAREDKDAYAERARNFFTASRAGTLPAIEQGALTVDGVASASAIEVLTNGSPARLVQLVVADLAGVCNRVLAAKVQQALLEYRCGGVGVIILSSVPEMVSGQLALQFAPNVDTSTLSTNVRQAIVDYINGLGANDTLYRSDLAAVLARYKSQGLIASQGSIVTPVGDVVPDPGRTLRARLEDWTLV